MFQGGKDERRKRGKKKGCEMGGRKKREERQKGRDDERGRRGKKWDGGKGGNKKKDEEKIEAMGKRRDIQSESSFLPKSRIRNQSPSHSCCLYPVHISAVWLSS